MYRMFAALSPTIDDAVRFSGTALNLLIVYTGYVIPKPQLISDYIWFGWIYYINPISYAFEAVLTNEFSDRTMACSPTGAVPYGPEYTDPSYQGCAIADATPGALEVAGSAYLEQTFSYTRSHLWRNFGVLIAFTVFYILITAVAAETFNFTSSGGGAVEFKKSKKAKKQIQAETAPADEEKAVAVATPLSETSSRTAVSPTRQPAKKEEETLQQISGSETVFTWSNVEYMVPYLGGERKLLNKVNGYAKPGVMVALMGASGAGKTTLLNTLGQRQKTGVVGGEMLVDGRPLGVEFQRGTGFCEQNDLHDGTATIREALEFSVSLLLHTDPRAKDTYTVIFA
jgi:ATP-binding cassette subfamily G (WHITE) protein 2 (SNQ2)